MKRELGVLLSLTVLMSGCKLSSNADFKNTAQYGVEITEGNEQQGYEILDCYTNIRPTIIHSNPPRIKGQEFICSVVHPLSPFDQGFDFHSKGSVDIFVDKAIRIRGNVEEIFPTSFRISSQQSRSG